MVEPSPDDLPPAARADALTLALRKCGALGDGNVLDVTVQSDRSTILSRIIRLRLTYGGPASSAPETVILKTGLLHTMRKTWNGGRQEVDFYTRVAPELPAGVVPRCFDAGWNPETGAWHLLLEDLTDTHVIATQWPLPPNQAQCETMLTALARLHAAWWDDPRLGVSIGIRLGAKAIDQFQQRLEGDYASFADRLGDNLSADRHDLFRRFLDAIPRLYARYQTGRDITIVQGDSHVWNCFLPRDGRTDARLFDWDSWRLQIATSDLAYMMAVHWYPDRRKRLEKPLLDHYHAELLASGVAGYDRRALHDDYRWSALLQVAVPVWQAANQIPPVIWWNNLERILLAVDDLDCRELLA